MKPWRIQLGRHTGAALWLALGLHALVLLSLTLHSMRPPAEAHLFAPTVAPLREMTLWAPPGVNARNSPKRASPAPAARHPPTRVAQTAAPSPQGASSRERQAPAGPGNAVAHPAQQEANGPEQALAAPVANLATLHAPRLDGVASQVSAPVLEPTQPVQNARPDYAYNPQPDYPLLLREQGVGGVVWLRVWVGGDGRPLEIKLAKGSGYRLLDDAAVRAVQLWRFIPAKSGEQKLASWVEFPIRFTLNG